MIKLSQPPRGELYLFQSVRLPEILRRSTFVFPLLGLWFGAFQIIRGNWDGSFAMDDPSLISFFSSDETSIWSKIYENRAANRWRPITDAFTYLAFQISQRNFTSWLILNFVLLLSAGVFLWLSLWKISSSIVIANFSLFIFWGQRHIAYQLITATGVVEGLSAFFFIMFLATIFKSYLETSVDHSKRWFFVSLLFFLALVLTHERFLILSPVLLLSTLFRYRGKTLFLFFPLALTVAISTPLYKRIVLDLPLLVGTGSAHELGFTLVSFRNHLSQAVFGLFGFEIGPAYLVGPAAMGSGELILWASALSFGCSFVLYFSRILSFSKSEYFNFFRKSEQQILLLAPLAAISLIVISSTTIRMEPRWLVTPLIALLFHVAVLRRSMTATPEIGKLFSRSLLILGICFTYTTTVFVKSIDGIYYRSHQVGVSILLKAIEGAEENNEDFGVVPVFFDADPAMQIADFKRYWVANRTEVFPSIVTPEDFRSIFAGHAPESLVTVLKPSNGVWISEQVEVGTILNPPN